MLLILQLAALPVTFANTTQCTTLYSGYADSIYITRKDNLSLMWVGDGDHYAVRNYTAYEISMYWDSTELAIITDHCLCDVRYRSQFYRYMHVPQSRHGDSLYTLL